MFAGGTDDGGEGVDVVALLFLCTGLARVVVASSELFEAGLECGGGGRDELLVYARGG